MTPRDLTAAEARWWRRFKSCVKDMPKSVEVIVQYSLIGIADASARREYFEATGDVDNIPLIETLETKRGFYPNGECL